MPRSYVAAASAVLVSAPLLAFPDLVPPLVRLPVVTLLAIAAGGIGLRQLGDTPWVRASYGMCAVALLVSWARLPAHDLAGLRHLSGVALGLLAMGLLAGYCRTERHLAMTATLIAVAGGAVLTVGLFSTSIDTAKFIDTWRFRPTPLYPWLPDWRLPLPGLITNGRVNPNALGGTALLLAPLCLAGVAGSFSLTGRWRPWAIAATTGASLVAVAVLGMSLSRTAWIGGILTLALAGLRWRRGRWPVAALLLAGSIAYSFWVPTWAPETARPIDEGMRHTLASFEERRLIWAEALDVLAQSPWLGVGINQFHEVSRTMGEGGSGRVAHAHNVFIQVALDGGVLALVGYLAGLAGVIWLASGTAARGGPAGRIAAGAGLALTSVHLFGLADAIALGAKVGLFQWLAAGLALAAARAASR